VSRGLFDDPDVLGVVFFHPAIDVVEEGIVIPNCFSVHDPGGQGLADPGVTRAAAPVSSSE
jgi:hypothetical protein